MVGPFDTSNKTINVVKRLVDPIKGTNRNLTIDNYYTTHELAMYLLENKTTLLGTVKKNRPEFPREFLPTKTREIGSS